MYLNILWKMCYFCRWVWGHLQKVEQITRNDVKANRKNVPNEHQLHGSDVNKIIITMMSTLKIALPWTDTTEICFFVFLTEISFCYCRRDGKSTFTVEKAIDVSI